MVRFGPSGFCDKFVEKYSHTEEMPAWLTFHGLDAYEYSFNKGIRITDEKAQSIKKVFEERHISLSVHGPYYINLANPDEEMAEKSKVYIIESLKKMRLMGAKYLVFHPGSLMKMQRNEAFDLVLKRLKELITLLDENGFDDMYICPETMGKHGQVGTVEEVAKMCALDKRIIPTLDFGHINAFGQGCLKTKSDFEDVFMTLKKYMGERFKKVHIHFSKIMYGDKGEIKHLNFDEDEVYGPNFEFLAEVLKEYDIDATVICESRGHQTEDSVKMKQIFQSSD
ncbi:MAG: TIM barrel protein [Clostridia bacterium]|nr:TIM barrel protein [Clostridia bacterium]